MKLVDDLLSNASDPFKGCIGNKHVLFVFAGITFCLHTVVSDDEEFALDSVKLALSRVEGLPLGYVASLTWLCHLQTQSSRLHLAQDIER